MNRAAQVRKVEEALCHREYVDPSCVLQQTIVTTAVTNIVIKVPNIQSNNDRPKTRAYDTLYGV
jgi:hypothetical protein